MERIVDHSSTNRTLHYEPPPVSPNLIKVYKIVYFLTLSLLMG